MTLIFQKGNKFDTDKLYSFIDEYTGSLYKVSYPEIAMIIIQLMRNEDEMKEKRYNGKGLGGKMLINFINDAIEYGEIPINLGVLKEYKLERHERQTVLNNGGDKMQVTKTEKFVKAEDIGGKTVFKILDEPIEVQGNYGKKLECRIQMQEGDDKALAKWSINNTSKDILIDGISDKTEDWVGTSIKVHKATINNKDSIIVNKEQF